MMTAGDGDEDRETRDEAGGEEWGRRDWRVGVAGEGLEGIKTKTLIDLDEDTWPSGLLRWEARKTRKSLGLFWVGPKQTSHEAYF